MIQFNDFTVEHSKYNIRFVHAFDRSKSKIKSSHFDYLFDDDFLIGGILILCVHWCVCVAYTRSRLDNMKLNKQPQRSKKKFIYFYVAYQMIKISNMWSHGKQFGNCIWTISIFIAKWPPTQIIKQLNENGQRLIAVFMRKRWTDKFFSFIYD